jgi:hypothetical protein
VERRTNTFTKTERRAEAVWTTQGRPGGIS